jgi:formylglycine-generating enzyme required for sulfatase activity
MGENIFISYRRGDSEGFAILLFDRLQDHYSDIRVFMDVSDFFAGGDYKGVVDTTIDSCKVMILIIGPEWELAMDEMGRSRLDDPHDFVRVELQAAIDRGVFIAPILVNREKMPKQDNLPFDLRELLKFDPIVIRTRQFDEYYSSLLKKLDSFLGKADNRLSKSNIYVKAGWSFKRGGFLFGFIIILIFLFTFWLQPKQEKKAFNSLISEAVEETEIVDVDITARITPKTPPIETVVIPTQTQSNIPTESSAATNSFSPTNTAVPTIALLAPQLIDPTGISMVLIPQGPFIMGTNDDEPWDLVSRPAAPIGLDVFYIDKFEVSNGHYAECVLDNVCNPPSKERSKTHKSYFGNPLFADFPVIYISWMDASTFCSWRGGRLPLEAEWEKAARGEGANTYPWGTETFDCQYANFSPDSACVGDTISVDRLSLGASPYGVLNLSGNVSEWVQDWFQAYPGGNPDATKDFGLTKRVVRGGAYFDGPNNIRTTSRSGLNPESSYSYVGFRCVIDIEALP